MLIIVVLLIAVLIVAVFLITRSGRIFTRGVSDCVAQEGTCLESTAACLEKGGQPLGFDCPKDKPACCKLS